MTDTTNVQPKNVKKKKGKSQTGSPNGKVDPNAQATLTGAATQILKYLATSYDDARSPDSIDEKYGKKSKGACDDEEMDDEDEDDEEDEEE